MDKMIETAAQLNAKTLKAEIKKLANVFTDEADLLIQAMLGALQQKISESDFVAFCDSM